MDVNVHTQIPYSQYGKLITGIDKGITNDILAMEIRQALHHLGEITEEITTDDLLDNPPAVGQVSSVSSACPPCPRQVGGWQAARRRWVLESRLDP